MNFHDFSDFDPITQNLGPLKLFTTNFLEALELRIWILMIKTGAGQEEIENDRQNQEHSPKNQPKNMNSYRPSFSQICPTVYKYCLDSA